MFVETGNFLLDSGCFPTSELKKGHFCHRTCFNIYLKPFLAHPHFSYILYYEDTDENLPRKEKYSVSIDTLHDIASQIGYNAVIATVISRSMYYYEIYSNYLTFQVPSIYDTWQYNGT